MKEKELYVLKYVIKKINGKKDIEYNCDIEKEYAVNEIAYYLRRLISKGYIRGRGWAMVEGEEVSVYKNNVSLIYYEKLVLTKHGKEVLNK
ncbi:hypothetical protein [Clostridium vincentii]|uniref:YjcQ protein n=1 Tax=Clostridium vincentii TaxID=52704 RepID=A0A2T0BC20_9CLOT|nr:hypothetical protein [Clostridium vincentii]PRR81357.1 hypothetical protein CLVI_25900 [Clostridium vincentii]